MTDIKGTLKLLATKSLIVSMSLMVSEAFFPPPNRSIEGDTDD